METPRALLSLFVKAKNRTFQKKKREERNPKKRKKRKKEKKKRKKGMRFVPLDVGDAACVCLTFAVGMDTARDPRVAQLAN